MDRSSARLVTVAAASTWPAVQEVWADVLTRPAHRRPAARGLGALLFSIGL